MNHLKIDIIRYERLGETIIGNIRYVVNADDRIAIVGPNGVGKSTLIKIISGEITEYDGNIENIGSMSLGYLSQIHFSDEEKIVRDDLRDAFSELRELEKKIATEEEKLAETGEYEAYTDALERYKLLGGYTYENEIERVARGIGIYYLLEKPISAVSGGERTKIALAKTLLSRPDFLLLDEPTNFIDLQSVEWLENYLTTTWKGGYCIISHDREFLDRTCTTTIEVLGPAGIMVYHGNYTFSVEEKEHAQILREKAYEEQQSFLESEKALINRFRAGSRASFAKSRERALEKVEILDRPMSAHPPQFSFSIPKEQSPESHIRIEDAFIGRTEPLFYIRDATLRSSERICIVGENGVGKSTLIKTLLGEIHELEGYVDLQRTIRVGYYTQMHESLDLEKSVKENFLIHGFGYSEERIGGILVQYNFSYHDKDKLVRGLSGGERSKLLFSFLAQREYDLLILDEPTNHLDYESREALERALKNYGGSLLFISHDRYFVNKLADKLWIIENGDLLVSYGNYDDYIYKKEHRIDYDMSLFDAEGEMNLILEEKLGREEAKRIKEKFSRKKRK